LTSPSLFTTIRCVIISPLSKAAFGFVTPWDPLPSVFPGRGNGLRNGRRQEEGKRSFSRGGICKISEVGSIDSQVRRSEN